MGPDDEAEFFTVLGEGIDQPKTKEQFLAGLKPKTAFDLEAHCKYHYLYDPTVNDIVAARFGPDATDEQVISVVAPMLADLQWKEYVRNLEYKRTHGDLAFSKIDETSKHSL